jgi:hypothetical protein
MNSTNLSILKVLSSITVVVVIAGTAVGVGISNKAAQAQQLPQPVLPPGAEVKPPTKSSIASRADNTI